MHERRLQSRHKEKLNSEFSEAKSLSQSLLLQCKWGTRGHCTFSLSKGFRPVFMTTNYSLTLKSSVEPNKSVGYDLKHFLKSAQYSKFKLTFFFYTSAN